MVSPVSTTIPMQLLPFILLNTIAVALTFPYFKRQRCGMWGGKKAMLTSYFMQKKIPFHFSSR